jgi:hypothetical protein
MLIIKHRVNSVLDLVSTPIEFGVEVDVKEKNGEIVCGHDPFDNEALFVDWVKSYRHKFVAVNIKQEGIESLVISILEESNIRDFFLFDLSFPMLIKLSESGETRLALRVSDLEGFEHAQLFVGKVGWIWLDIFKNGDFLSKTESIFEKFKVCAVSPELHARRDKQKNHKILVDLLGFEGLFDAVCTKIPSNWEAKIE